MKMGLKEEQPCDFAQFDGLACPPLDPDTLLFVQTLPDDLFDLSDDKFFDGIEEDLPQPEPTPLENMNEKLLPQRGKGKEMKLAMEAFGKSRLPSVQDWNDEFKLELPEPEPEPTPLENMNEKKPEDDLLPQRGKGKEMKLAKEAYGKSRLPSVQDWNDEFKLELFKRKLRQSYQDGQNKRRKIQLLDIKDLPVPKPKPKPPMRKQQCNNNKNKLLRCV